MIKTWAIGDIHGNFKGLKQALDRAEVNYENDTVIQLGDVVDGHSETFECVEELLKIKNLICLRGNHDQWFVDYLNSGFHADHWIQGGFNTAKSYMKQLGRDHLLHKGMQGYLIGLLPEDVPISHWKFFSYQHLYYIDDMNRLFVHAGYNRKKTISATKWQNPEIFYWDRDLMNQAMSCKQGILRTKDKFKEIFIGHTTTQIWGTTDPIMRGGVINLDTGGGSFGKITIMNVETHEFFQSDLASELYPDYKGR